jgi:hypothetical protein
VHEFPHLNTMLELGTSSAIGVDRYNFCQEMCAEILVHQNQIVGPRHTVEID